MTDLEECHQRGKMLDRKDHGVVDDGPDLGMFWEDS